MCMLIGEIQAKVLYSKKEKMELNQVSLVETGNVQKSYSINFKNFTINLNKTLPKFEKYDTINEDKKIKLFSDFYLPISLGIYRYHELIEEKRNVNVIEAKEILINKLKSQLSEEIGDENKITNIKVDTYEEEGSVTVEVIYEVLENIGTEEKIIF